MVKTGDDKQIGIDGNLMKKIPGQAYGIINYVEVSSVDEFSKKIITEGGKTIMPDTNTCYWAYCTIRRCGKKHIWHNSAR
jgi:predicted enzyme related to lactoylglutathione lyase